MIALRFSFSASGQLTTADSGPFSWLWLVNRIEDVSRLETGAVPELFSLVLTVFLSSGFLRHPFLLETACKWTSIADLNGLSLLCSLCSPRWWHRRWACRRHRRKSREHPDRRLGCKRQKKNKLKLWSFDWSTEYFYEAAKPLNFIIVQSRHSWEKLRNLRNVPECWQQKWNRWKFLEGIRASMFQCPGGPGLLPAFKMLKIEPRIPSKWLIVDETENCWWLFKHV